MLNRSGESRRPSFAPEVGKASFSLSPQVPMSSWFDRGALYHVKEFLFYRYTLEKLQVRFRPPRESKHYNKASRDLLAGVGFVFNL